jgi:hypothetical protein
MTDIAIEAIPGFRPVGRPGHAMIGRETAAGNFSEEFPEPPARDVMGGVTQDGLDAAPGFGGRVESAHPLHAGESNRRADPDPGLWRVANSVDEHEDLAPRRVDEPLSRIEVAFGVHVSMRYHARRRAWYDGLHRGAMLVLALGASGGAMAILGGLLGEAEMLSLAVAVAGALELAFDFPAKARVEDALYRRFSALASNIAAAEQAEPGQVEAWNAQRLLIKADADDRLEVLRRVCHNQEVEACGYGAAACYPLQSWQRLFAQMVTLPPGRPMGLG